MDPSRRTQKEHNENISLSFGRDGCVGQSAGMLRTARASVGAIAHGIINRGNAGAEMVKAGESPALLRWVIGNGCADEPLECAVAGTIVFGRTRSPT